MEFQYRVNFSSTNQQESAFPLLFTARMMVIFLLWIKGMDNILPPFLPFIEGLNVLRGQNWLIDLLDWVYWISLLLVFAGIRFRFFSLLIAFLIFFSIISSKLQFSNSFLYSGCIFFLVGIYKPGLEWIFRVQIALLYLGAGLNKVFDPDWLTGQYFHNFFSITYRNQLYLIVAPLIPGKGLALAISYATILAELGLGLWALINRKRVLLVVVINFFHLIMLLLTAGELSYIFYFLMAVSSYLILPWEEKKGTVISYQEGSRVFQFLKFFDFDRFFNWNSENVFHGHINIIYSKKNWRYLLGESILFNKFLYGFLTLIIVFFCRYSHHLFSLF
jgi:hypothetical protein